MSNTQDIADRRVYVIRPKQVLVDFLTPYLDNEDWEDREYLKALLSPYVSMTKELPFEEYLEGYRQSILKKCQEKFLEYELEFGILFQKLPDEISVENVFDKWWIIEMVRDYEEIETNSWKE